MEVGEFYRWEAEMSDGSVITKGGDLAGAIRVSIIPANGVPFPRHDFAGLRFERRFLKQFKHFTLNGPPDREANALDVDEKRGFSEEERKVRQEKRRKFWEQKGVELKVAPKPPNAAQCIETDDCRIWVIHLTGSVLITPKEYQLRL